MPEGMPSSIESESIKDPSLYGREWIDKEKNNYGEYSHTFLLEIGELFQDL